MLPPTKPTRLEKFRDAITPLLQVLLALVFLFIVTQKFALDIHIREPGKAIYVQLTVSDARNESVFSFCLAPLKT